MARCAGANAIYFLPSTKIPGNRKKKESARVNKHFIDETSFKFPIQAGNTLTLLTLYV